MQFDLKGCKLNQAKFSNALNKINKPINSLNNSVLYFLLKSHFPSILHFIFDTKMEMKAIEASDFVDVDLEGLVITAWRTDKSKTHVGIQVIEHKYLRGMMRIVIVMKIELAPEKLNKLIDDIVDIVLLFKFQNLELAENLRANVRFYYFIKKLAGNLNSFT